MDINAFDLLLLVLVGLLVAAGLVKGLTRLLIGIGALVAAFVLAARFHAQAAAALAGVTGAPAPAANLAGYLAIFLGTMLAGALLGRVLRGVLKAALLGWADRLAGGAAGLAAALLAAALIILPVVAYAPAGERVLRDSVLAPWVTVVADLANRLVPARLAEQYRERMDALQRHWRQRRDAAGPGTVRNGGQRPACDGRARTGTHRNLKRGQGVEVHRTGRGPERARSDNPAFHAPRSTRPGASGSAAGRPVPSRRKDRSGRTRVRC